MAVINIMSESDLINIISHIERIDRIDKSIKVENVIKMFPFHKLSTVDNSQRQHICLIAKILSYFVQNQLFVTDYTALSCSVGYIQNQLTFLMKEQGCGNLEYVNTLLDLLLQLISRSINLKGYRVNMENFCGLINTVLSSQYAYIEDIWKYCCNLFIGTMSIDTIDYQDINIYIKCVSSLLMLPDLDMLSSYEIINAIFRAQSISMIPEIETVYAYIEMSIKNVNKNMDNLTANEFVIAISHAFAVCKYNVILERISNELLKKFNIISSFRKNKEFLPAVVDILYNLIIRAFESTPWKDSELNAEVSYLASCTNWDTVKSDVIFLTYYIDFIYTDRTHVHGHISKTIIDRLQINIPTNPPVIKSIYLLYASYVIPCKNDVDNYFGHKLLRQLQHNSDISNILTFHVSQLLWILSRGSHVLKHAVMNAWLEKYDDDKKILQCIKKCKASPILIDLILKSPDCKNKQRASTLLSNLGDPAISNILLQSIPKALCDSNILKYILTAKPAMPDDKRAVTIAQQMSAVLSKKQYGNIIKHVIIYSMMLLEHFKKKPDILKYYLDIKIVSTLVMSANDINDELAVASLKFLIYLLQSQDFHKISVENGVAHDLGTILCHTSQIRIKSAFKLLDLIFKMNHKGPVLFLQKPAFGLLQSLLCLRNGEYGAKAYTTLVRLFRNEEYLCHCIDNYICVRIECKKPTVQKEEFLVYLKMWLKVVTRSGFCRIPDEIIYAFLWKLDDKYKEQALDISNILNKWQRRATTTIDI